jgi:hypothetical protein
MSEEEDEVVDDESEGEPAFVAAARSNQAEEPTFAQLPRDYVGDFGNRVQAPAIVEEYASQPAVSPLSAPASDQERDLDVPTFMRRMKF